MKRSICALLLAGALCAVPGGFAAPAAKAYQVTGPIVELTETKIVVQKDNEKWEIARTPETKVDGALKVGAKVTIHYTMTAKNIEVKAK